MTVSVKAKSVKLSAVTKEAQLVSGAITVQKAKGAVTYQKVEKGSSPALIVGKLSGKIKVRKGTKKGTYLVRVKVTSAGTRNYKAASKIVTVKIVVK